MRGAAAGARRSGRAGRRDRFRRRDPTGPVDGQRRRERAARSGACCRRGLPAIRREGVSPRRRRGGGSRRRGGVDRSVVRAADRNAGVLARDDGPGHGLCAPPQPLAAQPVDRSGGRRTTAERVPARRGVRHRRWRRPCRPADHRTSGACACSHRRLGRTAARGGGTRCAGGLRCGSAPALPPGGRGRSVCAPAHARSGSRAPRADRCATDRHDAFLARAHRFAVERGAARGVPRQGRSRHPSRPGVRRRCARRHRVLLVSGFVHRQSRPESLCRRVRMAGRVRPRAFAAHGRADEGDELGLLDNRRPATHGGTERDRHRVHRCRIGGAGAGYAAVGAVRAAWIPVHAASSIGRRHECPRRAADRCQWRPQDHPRGIRRRRRGDCPHGNAD